MLLELAVRDLGVLADLNLVLDRGMTAVTGETGAGKTLVVGAIELLVGGRADATLVRPGSAEARIEGRFLVGDDEVVLARVIPAEGRSRAYVNGRLAPVAALAEHGAALVDLHGQHAHQSLLGTAVQRAALDRFGGIDLAPMQSARGRVTALDAELAALGGDERARAHELDLLRFQLGELEAAGLEDPDEEARLDAEEDELANAVAHREAAELAHEALAADGGAADSVATALAALAGRPPFAELEGRLRSVAAEIAEATADIRGTGESIDDDPERLAAVRARRQQLRDLCRKYGDTVADVMAFAGGARRRLAELDGHAERAAALEAERREAEAEAARAAAAVAAARRAAAPALAAAVEAHLADLAMASARVEIAVAGADPADEVAFLLAANRGGPLLPLAKVASGGELARAMLALRLVLTAGPPVLVFDEVDAGIGGEAAVAVGRSLAGLGRDHQVLVVTHLPQVAAFADAHVGVVKHDAGGRTVATAARLDDGERVVELSRMLAGQPGSTSARDHAAELLETARAVRTGRAFGDRR